MGPEHRVPPGPSSAPTVGGAGDPPHSVPRRVQIPHRGGGCRQEVSPQAEVALAPDGVVAEAPPPQDVDVGVGVADVDTAPAPARAEGVDGRHGPGPAHEGRLVVAVPGVLSAGQAVATEPTRGGSSMGDVSQMSPDRAGILRRRWEEGYKVYSFTPRPPTSLPESQCTDRRPSYPGPVPDPGVLLGTTGVRPLAPTLRSRKIRFPGYLP